MPKPLEASAHPRPLTLTGASEGFAVEAAADGADPAAPKRFRMTAYTGGAMRVSRTLP